MKKWVIIFVVVILLGITVVGIRMAMAPEDITFAQTIQLGELPDLAKIVPENLSEKVAVAIDGQVAFQNSDATQATASTAKMIMAVMVMEKKPFKLGETGETITINQQYYQRYSYYITHNGSNTRVQLGEQISEYDALVSALLASSNNMADTLAMWAFGSFEEYKLYAQTRLAEWGLKNTTIGIDASGYSNTTTSTAADLAIIAQKLMENPVLAEIVGLKSHDVPVAGTIKNTNKILGQSGILGIKTGWIGASSGYCLATAYKLNEHLITVIVLNATTRDVSFERSKTIVDALQASLKETMIVKKDQEVGYYESWWGGCAPIVATEDGSALIWTGTNPKVQLKMNESIDGQETTGTLEFVSNNGNMSIPVTTKYFRAAPSFGDKLRYALNLHEQ
ncbi:MAG: serine hydrolase [Candidatus Saccharibacteria bacterium]|nr:serine hydrolase [Candidatus Saccharibacteria bacterium]